MGGLAVLIISLGFLYYRYQARIIIEGTERQLISVVELHSRELTHWRNERLGDARFYQNNRSFLALAKARLDDHTATQTDEFEIWLGQTQASHRYEILLLDATGRLALSTPANIDAISTTELAEVRSLSAADAPTWIDFHRLGPSGDIRLTLLIPLRDPDLPTNLMGVMLWRIDPAHRLYPTLQKWPVPTVSGEMALVRRNGDEMVYLAPLRSDPDAALARTVPLSEVSLPGVHAALGHTGIVMDGIFRGEPVIAAVTQVAGTPWGLFARINRDEALAPLRQLRRTSVLVVSALLLATLGITAFFWRRHELGHLRELQETAKKLRDSEQRLTALLQASPTIIYKLSWDATAPKAIYVSSNIERILGYSWREALEPNWWYEHVHPDDRTVAARFLSRLQSEDQLSHVYRFLLKDGRTVMVQDQLRLERDDSGKPLEIVGAWTDITAEKERLEELRLKSAALDAAANAIVITNLDGTIEWANTAFTQLTGYESGEIIHRSHGELVKSGVQGRDFYQELWDTILAGKTWNGELVNRRKDGTHYPEEMTISPVKDAGGRITHFIAIKQDVSEKKLLLEQHLKAQRLESLGMLAAGIAHDLNNMLTPIIFSGSLLRRSLTAERDLKIVTMVEGCAERGAKLVNQIMAFAKGADGDLRITQLKHLARDVITLAQNSFPVSIRIEANIPSDVWPVMANPSQIHQILLNLCINARDAMPDGGTLTLAMHNRELTTEEVAEVPAAKPGKWLVMEVTDTGTGIPPEVLPRIFDVFFTTKAPGKGTGLGLNTVRTIVQAHHGFIQVKTEPGQGTTMQIFLPASTDPDAEESAAARGLVKGNGELILLVDDDPNVRESLKAVLVQGGYRVLPCADGVEAIVLYQSNSHQIDLVITDVEMPNLNGAVLAATLHQLKPDLHIIAISGLSSATHIALVDAKKHVRTFLHKPFGAMDLLRAVHELLHPPV